MAAIERGLAVLIPPVAAAAFAALKLLTQFCNLGGSFPSKCDEEVTDIGKETKKKKKKCTSVFSKLLLGLAQDVWLQANASN